MAFLPYPILCRNCDEIGGHDDHCGLRYMPVGVRTTYSGFIESADIIFPVPFTWTNMARRPYCFFVPNHQVFRIERLFQYHEDGFYTINPVPGDEDVLDRFKILPPLGPHPSQFVPPPPPPPPTQPTLVSTIPLPPDSQANSSGKGPGPSKNSARRNLNGPQSGTSAGSSLNSSNNSSASEPQAMDTQPSITNADLAHFLTNLLISDKTEQKKAPTKVPNNAAPQPSNPASSANLPSTSTATPNPPNHSTPIRPSGATNPPSPNVSTIPTANPDQANTKKLEETIRAQGTELANLRSLIEDVAKSIHTLSQSRINPPDGSRDRTSHSVDQNGIPPDGDQLNNQQTAHSAPNQTNHLANPTSVLGVAPSTPLTLSDSISGSISNTLNQRLLDSQIVSSVPSFDGDKAQFRDWRTKVESVQPMFAEATLKTVIRTKLGAKPNEYLKTLPGVERLTVTEMIQALAKQYDPVGDSMSAAVAFQNLHQGMTPIIEHHAHIISLLNIMGKTTSSTEQLLLSQYINSLKDYSLRKRLFAKRSQGKTLADLMEIAQEDSANTRLANYMATDQGDDAAGIVAVVGPRRYEGRTPTRPQNQKANENAEDVFCPIHRTKSHSLDECRAKYWNNCPYCQLVVQKGTLAKHREGDECPGLICFKCREPGHRSGRCPNNNPQPRKRSHPDSQESTDQPPAKRTVAVITEATNVATETVADKPSDSTQE